jgi:recombination endonuclease VII
LTSPERARAQRLKNFFHLTVELWNLIDAYQHSLCFVCRKPQKSGKRLSLDHSHKTGLLRGLLCSTCNRALGRIERSWGKDTDVVLMLERLLEFLKNPPATLALGKEIYTFAGRFGTERHRKYLKEQRS